MEKEVKLRSGGVGTSGAFHRAGGRGGADGHEVTVGVEETDRAVVHGQKGCFGGGAADMAAGIVGVGRAAEDARVEETTGATTRNVKDGRGGRLNVEDDALDNVGSTPGTHFDTGSVVNLLKVESQQIQFGRGGGGQVTREIDPHKVIVVECKVVADNGSLRGGLGRDGTDRGRPNRGSRTDTGSTARHKGNFLNGYHKGHVGELPVHGIEPHRAVVDGQQVARGRSTALGTTQHQHTGCHIPQTVLELEFPSSSGTSLWTRSGRTSRRRRGEFTSFDVWWYKERIVQTSLAGSGQDNGKGGGGEGGNLGGRNGVESVVAAQPTSQTVVELQKVDFQQTNLFHIGQQHVAAHRHYGFSTKRLGQNAGAVGRKVGLVEEIGFTLTELTSILR